MGSRFRGTDGATQSGFVRGGGIVDLTLGGVANKYPLAGTVITESSNWIKSATMFNDVSSQLNNAVQNRK
jgi:filamentous hemagglutinin